jgi:hypothetical protein
MEWARRLLRLFHLYNGDLAIAESLTVQTLAERAGSGRVPSKGGFVDLLRRALTKPANALSHVHLSVTQSFALSRRCRQTNERP